MTYNLYSYFYGFLTQEMELTPLDRNSGGLRLFFTKIHAIDISRFYSLRERPLGYGL